MSKYLIGLFLIGFVSCTPSGKDKTFSFDKVVPLESKTLDAESVEMKYPFRVRQVDSLLYISDLNSEDYFCHIFRYPDMEFIRSFAKRGDGPEEYLIVENIRVKNNESVWVLDSYKRKISLYDYEENNAESVIDLDERLVKTLDFVPFGDSLFVVPDYTGESKICFIDMKGNIVKKMFPIPDEKLEKKISRIAYAQVWRSFMDYNENNHVLALATQLGETIELYDLKADTVINTITGKAGAPKYRINSGYAVPDGIMGYGDVYVGDKNIYALFWGLEFKDIRNGNRRQGGHYVQVFDLKGNPIVEYELDAYLNGFYVNEKEKKIIGLDGNSNQPVKEFSFL